MEREETKNSNKKGKIKKGEWVRVTTEQEESKQRNEENKDNQKERYYDNFKTSKKKKRNVLRKRVKGRKTMIIAQVGIN